VKRAILHSFNSQVPLTVSKLDDWFDVVICLDSHLDDSLGVDPVVDAYPEKVRLAALRASAHSQLRMCIGGLPALRNEDDFVSEMLIVLPRRSILASVGQMNDLIENAKALGKAGTVDEISLEAYVSAIGATLGVEFYYSPPKDLLKLADRARETEMLLDLDLDYISDMQAECYSPLKSVSPGELNWSEKVLKFIRKSRPETITLSEVKASAIHNPESNFSKFASKLRSLGYEIEEKEILDDEQAQRLLDLYEECYEKIIRKYKIRAVSESQSSKTEDSLSYVDEEIREIREFFRTKGFAN
jgi:hypothetical protein